MPATPGKSGKRVSSRASSKKSLKLSSATEANVLAVLSHVLGRSVFAKKAGFQYGGDRDVYAAAGYPPQDGIDFAHYWGLYRRNELAARIIDLPVNTTWRTPPEVLEAKHDDDMVDDEDADEDGESLATQAHQGPGKKQSAFEHEFITMANRLRLWHYLRRADVCSGIGRYAIMLIVVRGHDDTELKTPLTKVDGPTSIATLVPYTEGNADIAKMDWTPGPHFGQPLMYSVRLAGSNKKIGGTVTTGQRVEVHWTRVLHVAEGKIEDEVYGTPRLERGFNRLFDLEKIAASTAESYWQVVGRVLQAKIADEAEVTPAQMDDLEEKLKEIVHDLRRQFYSKGIDLSWMEGQVVPVKDIGDFYFSLIAAAAGIPKRILFGSELGELASSTDQQTFFGTIGERQESFAELEMLRPFIDRMLAIGALPPPETGEYNIVWPTLFKESEKDLAEANARTSAAAASLAGVGGNPLALVEVDEDRRVFLVPRAPGESEEEVELPSLPEDAPDDPEQDED